MNINKQEAVEKNLFEGMERKSSEIAQYFREFGYPPQHTKEYCLIMNGVSATAKLFLEEMERLQNEIPGDAYNGASRLFKHMKSWSKPLIEVERSDSLEREGK